MSSEEGFRSETNIAGTSKIRAGDAWMLLGVVIVSKRGMTPSEGETKGDETREAFGSPTTIGQVFETYILVEGQGSGILSVIGKEVSTNREEAGQGPCLEKFSN